MDAVVLAGVQGYWALRSETLLWRTIFFTGASIVLLLEAFLFRRGTQRLAYIVPALLLICLPLSPFVLVPYASYYVIMFTSELTTELVLLALITAFVMYFCVARPIRKRSARRRKIVPIPPSYAAASLQPQPQPPPPVHSSPSTPVATDVITPVPSQTVPSISSVEQAAAAREQFFNVSYMPRNGAQGIRRRRGITRSHELAARLYAESEARRMAMSPRALRAARAKRQASQRSAARQEAAERIKDAEEHLRKSFNALRAAQEESRNATTARDERVRQLSAAGEAGDGAEFDSDTESLFEVARSAAQCESEALRQVNEARAALADVEQWARSLNEDL